MGMRPVSRDLIVAVYGLALGSTPLAGCTLGSESVTGTATATATATVGTEGEETSEGMVSTGTTTGTSSTGTDTGLDESSGTAEPPFVDPCLQAPVGACPVGCVVIQARPNTGEGCLSGPNEMTSLCVTAGDPIDPGTRTSYYAEIDGQIVYALTGHPCSDGIAIRPELWTECTTAAETPDGCTCLCGADGCPHDAQVNALNACDLPTPCGPPVDHKGFFEYTEYDLCMLAALRDRTVGSYSSRLLWGTSVPETRVYLAGGDQVQAVHRHPDDLCFSPIIDAWDPAMTCTLQPPQWFDDCLAAELPDQEQCVLGTNWLQGCVETTPSCP